MRRLVATWGRVLQLEVLIGELFAIDGLATSAVAVGEVASLDHEVLDDTVESAHEMTVLGLRESTSCVGTLTWSPGSRSPSLQCLWVGRG